MVASSYAVYQQYMWFSQLVLTVYLYREGIKCFIEKKKNCQNYYSAVIEVFALCLIWKNRLQVKDYKHVNSML